MKSIKLPLTALIVFLSLFSFGNLDSLKTAFHAEKNAEKRLELAYEISKKTISSNPDTTAWYLFTVFKDSAKYPKSTNLAKCLNVMGIYYFYRSQFDSTIYYASRAIGISLRNNDTASSIMPRKNIALARRSLGEYNLALNEFFEVLEFNKTQQNIRNIAATLNDIGNTYSYLKDYTEAKRYQYEALKYLNIEPNPGLEGNIYNSLAYNFDKLGLVDSAIVYYEKSLILKEKGGNIYSIIITRNNLCILIDYKNKPEECEKCLLELLKDQRKANDSKGVARTLLNLSVQYRYYNDCDRAIGLLDSTRYYLSLANDIFLKQRYFEQYAKTLHKCGATELAYQIKDSLLRLNDSIFALEKRQELLELDTKYQTRQKTENIKMLETENANAKLMVQNQRWQILVLILFLVTIIGGGIFFFYTIKQRQKKEREIALIKMRETERVRIAHDMHDEIGSGLTRISLISERLMQESSQKKNLDTDGISKIIKQSRTLSKNLKEIIWAIDPSNDKFSELLYYFRDYIYDFSSNSNIECTIDFPDDALDFEVASNTRRNLFLALKEILNNTAKHANAKNVAVKFYFENNAGFLSVSDDGDGFDLDSVKNGVGMDSIKSRTEKLGGTINIETILNKGTTIILSKLALITTKV